MYNKIGASTAPVQVAMTEEQEEEEEKSLLQNDDLIKVEGTRVMFSKNLVEQSVYYSHPRHVLQEPRGTVSILLTPASCSPRTSWNSQFLFCYSHLRHVLQEPRRTVSSYFITHTRVMFSKNLMEQSVLILLLTPASCSPRTSWNSQFLLYYSLPRHVLQEPYGTISSYFITHTRVMFSKNLMEQSVLILLLTPASCSPRTWWYSQFLFYYSPLVHVIQEHRKTISSHSFVLFYY
jgi:hypothetical protein